MTPRPPEPPSYGQRISDLARDRPDDIALVFAAVDGSEQQFTWADLARRGRQIAVALRARGVGPADRVSIRLVNSPELVETVLATWMLGAVPVPVRWDLPDWECERVLQAIDAALDIGPDDQAWLTATVDGPDDLVSDAVPPQTHGICSSGSTGTPKVIVIERPARWEPVEPFVSGWIDVPTPQIVLVPAPLYHTNGFATLGSLLAGDRLVLLERFDAGRLVDLIERHRVTTFTATPTMLQPHRRRVRRRRPRPRFAGVGAPRCGCHRRLARATVDRPPRRRALLHGLRHDRGPRSGRDTRRRVAPAPRQRRAGLPRTPRSAILDPDHHDLPPDEIGEIFLRWPAGVTYAYLGGASRLSVTADGFATAGDLGFLDADGFLHVVDRRSDLIVSGGANVYPAEVESALIDHDGIVDVVVIGLADPEWGRRVHAIVEPRDPSRPPADADVIAYAKSRLAPYKVPKTVEFVDHIPRSAATKVSRRALVEAREA